MSDSQPAPIGYPSWAQEIASLLPTAALFSVSGNVRDIYFKPDGKVAELPVVLAEILGSYGFSEVAVIRPGGDSEDEPAELWAKATCRPTPPVDASVESLGPLARFLNEPRSQRALIVLDGSRCVTTPGELTDAESAMFTGIRRAVDDQPIPLQQGSNPLIGVSEAAHDVPPWLTGGNPRGRTISIPLPTASERDLLARRNLGNVKASEADIAHARRQLINQTDGRSLRSISQVTTLARARGEVLTELDDALRVYRLGVLDNPWKQPYLIEQLRNEVKAGSGGSLRQRVRGQDAAIDKALDVLVRSVSGLKSAQTSSRSSKPRGVLFFAGPTGVGKTELAKSLTELVFGDEASMIRFDMSEFAAEHSVERLVGAPPGFVGFAQGGELTNAVRQRPFSLLLFDEIEKADHRLLDRFLQILDDGRLTDGRGETTYFTETVLVFTSNLGIYDTVTHPVTGQVIGRKLAVDPAAGYAELAQSVASRVREHFTSVVGRPELLNRIGDNIVVFDFIRSEVGWSILNMMEDNVERTFEREYGSVLTISPGARSALREICLTAENLMMGGRGIGNLIETALIDPLARWAFAQEQVPTTVIVDGVDRLENRYQLAVRP